MSAGTPGAFVAVKVIPGGWIRAALACAAEPPLADGDLVVVQTDSGVALASVLARPTVLMERYPPNDQAPRILRRASNQDQALRVRHDQREREAFRLCVMKIRERGLAMKLARVEQLFDASRLVFFFTSEERVDFRELVRELASEFKTRIELRQIGVRDEARLLSGYGTCGRPLCCSTWLKSFEPVSIKMAKQQDLALNPSRLSGLCGRLKCCLRYELNHGAAAAPRDEAFPGSSGDNAPPAGGAADAGRAAADEPSSRRDHDATRPASARDRGQGRGRRRRLAVCTPVLYGRIPHAGREAGRSRRKAGRARTRAIVAAVNDAMSGEVDARCHGADQQEGLCARGPAWRGHTELLAHLTGAPPSR
jgi:cell fate regulator YaaT (PSP1 superfamily)